MRPILFEIKFLGLKIPLFSYGVMLAIAFIAAAWIASRRAEKLGYPKDEYYNTTIAVMIGSLLGARLFYVIQNFRDYAGNPLDILKVWEGGLVFYGGLIGGIIGAIYYIRTRKLDASVYFDAGAPSMGIGLFFTRIGCFLNGCGFGKPTTLFWGITFPAHSKAWWQQVQDGLIDINTPHSLPVHPTEPLSSLNGLIIFILFSYLLKKRSFRWQIFLGFLMYYSVSRFVIEILRGDKIRGFVGPLSTSQFVGIFVFLASLLLYIYLSKDEKNSVKS